MIAKFRDELHEEATALAEKEDVLYVGAHSRVVAKKIKSLSQAEARAIQKEKEDWVQKGPPPAARRL